MKSRPLPTLAAALLLCTLAAATAAPQRSPRPRLRIAMLTDGGGWEDRSFNQSCREGLEALLNHFPIYANFVETDGPTDYARHIAEMAERGYRLIIGVGIRLAPDIEKLAPAYPRTLFATVDGGSPLPPKNVRSLVFRVEECAFPAGYLAAAWADLQDPEDPAVAWIGGMNVESVTSFSTPFCNGAKYYNKLKKRRVRILGGFINSFLDEDAAQTAAEHYLANGADVLFAPAGLAGLSAIRAAKNAGKWAVGVDSDQYDLLYPERNVLLTSCIKRMDRAIMQLCIAVCENQFWGGGSYEGRLANNGVGLAPYHDFESKIPDELKQEVQNIQQAIAANQLDPFAEN